MTGKSGFFARLFSAPKKRNSYDAFLRGEEGTFVAHSLTGLNVTQHSVLASAAVFACTNMLAADIAKLRPYLFTRNSDGSISFITEHPVARLLRKPNEWQTPLEFKMQMQAALVLRGNAYAVIVRNERGAPIKLVPINPDQVSILESTAGYIFYRVVRCGRHQIAQLAHLPLEIISDDMLHIKGMGSNGLWGYSPITLARDTIGLALAQEQMAAGWMGNGGQPQGILTTDRKLTEASGDRSYNSWNAAHKGVRNAGKIAVLDNGLKFQPLSMTSQDMDFLASRSFQLQEIARWFRIPLHMLADASFKNNAAATVVQAAQEYVNLTLSTYTEMWAQSLSCAFALEDDGIEIGWDFNVLLRADSATRIGIYQKAVMGGVWTQNEARADDGRNPLPGGDVLLMPSNSTPYGSDHSGDAPIGAGPTDATGQK